MAQPQPERSPPPDDQLTTPDLHVANANPGPAEFPGPALGEPGRYVVQVNVEDDMPEGSSSKPVDEAATQFHGVYFRRTLAMVVVAILVVLLLALPVVFGIAELVLLTGVIGAWIWAWVALMAALLIGAVVIGFRIARSGL
ncbi:MAG: hypothetical protein ACRDIY_20475 [Chloroflexota bacterium]